MVITSYLCAIMREKRGNNKRRGKEGVGKPTNFKGKPKSQMSFRKKSAGGARPKPTLLFESNIIRLNRYIANAGVCARREADILIQAGTVTVNGEVVTELGTKVKLDDIVKYNGARINPEKPVYLILNKPKDYVTTLDDSKSKKSVMDLIARACKERIFPVGKLDRYTMGILLFTNDVEFEKMLTHPGHEVKKIYHVFTDKNVSQEHLDHMGNGVKLDDGIVKADAVSFVDEDKRQIGIELHSGKDKIVKRLFEHFGYNIKKLDRVYLGGLTKKDLPRGKHRFLSQEEVMYLKRSVKF